MDDYKLERLLQSVGHGCFVEYFAQFKSTAISNKEIAKQLRCEKGYTEKSCSTRVSKARKIIKEGITQRALEMIVASDSPQVTEEIRKQALLLLSSPGS